MRTKFWRPKISYIWGSVLYILPINPVNWCLYPQHGNVLLGYWITRQAPLPGHYNYKCLSYQNDHSKHAELTTEYDGKCVNRFLNGGSGVDGSLRHFTVFALVVVYVFLIQLHFDFRCVRGLRTRFADNSHNKKHGTNKIPKQAQLMLQVLKI